ncbi:hypothetical protein AK830_g5999 [Neonectria ditissima]|uniref:Heterokaryon incompatibility domain-containing protein n=1 Tax=Neonectria ditissima TaxID=78410 RepID=A0A0N8H722_9HYPO|nr:hypothetical protein AK830_g5999 [Neonectria ditissima]
MTPDLSQLPPYRYSALSGDDFRIIHVHPREQSESLFVSLEVVKAGCSRFGAVSYAWGRNERIHRIYAGDSIVVETTDTDGEANTRVSTNVPPSGYLMITDNLRKVLLSIRREDVFVALWVDSLCINQDHVAEKTNQVKNMKTFYACAFQTVICLTDFDEMMPIAFKSIEALAAMEKWETDKLPRRLSDAVPLSSDDAVSLGMLGRSETVSYNPWEVFMDFLELPWFHRVWIIQEVVISERPIISTSHGLMLWETLVSACRVVSRSKMHDIDAGRVHVNIPLELEEQRQSMRKVINARSIAPVPEDSDLVKDLCHKMHLIQLQMRSRGCHATDPRDHVFALLGIAKGHGGHAPEVDYSLSLAEVYARVAYAWFKISRRRPLTWLMCINGSYDAIDLPSWVPDWRRPWNGKPFLTSLGREEGISSSEGAKRCKVKFPELITPLRMPLQLQIRGIQILRIKDVEPVKTERWKTGRHGELINSFPEPYPTTYLTYHEAFFRSIMLAHPICAAEEGIHRQESFWSYRRGPWEQPRLRPMFRQDIDQMRGPLVQLSVRFHDGETDPSFYMSSSVERSKNEPRYTQEDLYSNTSPFYRVRSTFPQDEFVRSRTWFITEDGFMGLAPDISKPGDVIVYLFGGDFPFVMREKREENGKTIWGFVGECFVLGLLGGDLDNGLPEDEVEDFIIE